MNQQSISKKIFHTLFCLTVLFVFAQFSFLLIHYTITELIDSLVKSSISLALFRSANAFPILEFLAIQVIAYLMFVTFITFVAISCGNLLSLSYARTYGFALVFWLLGCITILTLNAYCYPNSFFAQPFINYPRISNLGLIISIFSLFIATLVAYIHFFYAKCKSFLGLFFLTFALFMGALKWYETSVSAAKPAFFSQKSPNIILIGLDSVRPDFIGFFGKRDIETPNINEFLNSATVFTQAYTPLGRTFPAWISILTAKYPIHHHARVNIADPAPIISNDTLAKRLKLAGYETMYGTDEPRFTDIDEQYGFDRIIGPHSGISEFVLAGLGDFPLTNLLINLPLGRVLFPYHYGNRAADVTYVPDAFLHLIQIALANRKIDKPLFLSVHLCLSHWPYSWAGKRFLPNMSLPLQYAVSVEAVDQQLGKLMQVLKSAGLLAQSIVVLFSDHGITIGLPEDRVIDKKNLLDDPANLRRIKSAKLSNTSQFSIDFHNDYSINTSYGTGTDVLSLKQYRVLLAFKRYGKLMQKHEINQLTTLLDIAPTVLDMLHLDTLKNVDGTSLKLFFTSMAQDFSSPRHVFFETADTLSDLETDKIVIEKILQQSLAAYFIDAKTGRLMMNPLVEKSIIKAKQRAILSGDWLLARYPAQIGYRLVVDKSNKNNTMTYERFTMEPYFVLVNLKTGKWTIDLSSSYAKQSPTACLLHQLKLFYGNEL